MSFDWTNVNSSNIKALCYDSITNALLVKFQNDTIYEYSHVEQDLADEIKNSSSVGGTFSCLIKRRPEVYPFRKLS